LVSGVRADATDVVDELAPLSAYGAELVDREFAWTGVDAGQCCSHCAGRSVRADCNRRCVDGHAGSAPGRAPPPRQPSARWLRPGGAACTTPGRASPSWPTAPSAGWRGWHPSPARTAADCGRGEPVENPCQPGTRSKSGANHRAAAVAPRHVPTLTGSSDGTEWYEEAAPAYRALVTATEQLDALRAVLVDARVVHPTAPTRSCVPPSRLARQRCGTRGRRRRGQR
jgi:hypothetical protein